MPPEKIDKVLFFRFLMPFCVNLFAINKKKYELEIYLLYKNNRHKQT